MNGLWCYVCVVLCIRWLVYNVYVDSYVHGYVDVVAGVNVYTHAVYMMTSICVVMGYVCDGVDIGVDEHTTNICMSCGLFVFLFCVFLCDCRCIVRMRMYDCVFGDVGWCRCICRH